MTVKRQNNNNQSWDNNADGFDVAGGTTARKLTLSGGDISMAGSGSAVITFPSTTSTLLSTANVVTLAQGGTGQNALVIVPTASTIVGQDVNKNYSTMNLIEGFRTQATATGTTTLVVGDAYTQVFTGSATQTVLLPTTGIVAGQSYTIVNKSTLAVTVQSSGANTIVILATGTFATFTALVATPTTAANWNFWYEGDIIASGKVFNVSNSITLAGTDATTITLPASTGTVPLNNQPFFIGLTSCAINRTSASMTLAGITLTTPVIGAATGTSVVLTGAITSSGTAGIGYATGAGGTVTQATSKVTAFTLSKTCGTIQFAADALASQTTTAGATWTNTTIAAGDNVYFTHQSGGTLGAYQIACNCGAGTATVYIRNTTGGSLSEAPVFKFTVVKGVTV